MELIDCHCTDDCGRPRKMKQTDWRPTKYQDPMLRQYKFKMCHNIEYLVDNYKYLKANRLVQGRINLKQ